MPILWKYCYRIYLPCTYIIVHNYVTIFLKVFLWNGLISNQNAKQYNRKKDANYNNIQNWKEIVMPLYFYFKTFLNLICVEQTLLKQQTSVYPFKF